MKGLYNLVPVTFRTNSFKDSLGKTIEYYKVTCTQDEEVEVFGCSALVYTELLKNQYKDIVCEVETKKTEYNGKVDIKRKIVSIPNLD